MDKMKENKKNFNRYVFLSSFARNLLEVFIGSILLKNGYSFYNVMFYYFLANLFSVIIAIPCTFISKKYSNKGISVIGILSFIVLQFFLNFIDNTMLYLYIIAFLFALYRRCYWISRRYYTLQVIDDKKNISKMFSIISIINQVGVITSAYIGSLLLQYINMQVITFISIALLVTSVYFVLKLDFVTEKNETKIRLFETIRCVPKSSILHIACFELQNVVKFLLPIYLILYVKDSYTTIGIVNLIANISTLIFTYLYGCLINKNRNYLKFSIIFVLLVRILQVNTTGIILLIASFMEGFSFKTYEQSFNKLYLILSKNYEFHNYNFLYEMTQDVGRLVVFTLAFILFKDVKYMIYFVLFAMSLCLFVKFRTEPAHINSEVIWKE